MTQHIKDTCQDSMSVDRPGGGGAGIVISGNEMDAVRIAGNTAEGGLIYKDIVQYEYRRDLLSVAYGDLENIVGYINNKAKKTAKLELVALVSILRLRNLVSPIKRQLTELPSAKSFMKYSEVTL